MQPFEKHPANPGELQSYGDQLIAEGAQSLQLGRSTREAYSPAVDSVQGVPAPAVAAAPYPVDQRSRATAGAMVWGAVTVQFWGDQVGQFNAKVDEILARLETQQTAIRNDFAASPPAGTPPGQTSGAEASAQMGAIVAAMDEWRAAHGQFIQQGGAQAAAMLQQGPTAGNLQIARDSGVMPQLSHKQNLLDQIIGKSETRHFLRFPYGQGIEGGALFGAERGFNMLGVAEHFGKWRSQEFIPRDANRLLPRNPDGSLMTRPQWNKATPLMERARALGDTKNWVPRNLEAVQQKAALKELGRFGKFGGALTSAAAGAVDQWHRDDGNTELTDGDKVARSGVRAATSGAGSLAGVWAGVKVGAVGGALVGGPVGALIGGIGGAIVGGVAGGAAGNWVADRALYDDGQGPDLSDPYRPGIGGV